MRGLIIEPQRPRRNGAESTRNDPSSGERGHNILMPRTGLGFPGYAAFFPLPRDLRPSRSRLTRGDRRPPAEALKGALAVPEQAAKPMMVEVGHKLIPNPCGLR